MLGDNNFAELLGEAFKEIRDARIVETYSLAEDDSNETLFVRRQDGHLYDNDRNLVPNLLETKYEYMIDIGAVVKTGTIDEAQFNTDDVFGIEVFAIESGGDLFDIETGEVTKYNEYDVRKNPKKYANFLYGTENEAKAAIRSSDIIAKAVKLSADPAIIKKSKSQFAKSIQKKLRFTSDDIKMGYSK